MNGIYATESTADLVREDNYGFQKDDISKIKDREDEGENEEALIESPKYGLEDSMGIIPMLLYSIQVCNLFSIITFLKQ